MQFHWKWVIFIALLCLLQGCHTISWVTPTVMFGGEDIAWSFLPEPLAQAHNPTPSWQELFWQHRTPPLQPCEEPSLPALGPGTAPCSEASGQGCCSAAAWAGSLGDTLSGALRPSQAPTWGPQCSTLRLVVALWCFSLHLWAPSLPSTSGGPVPQICLSLLCCCRACQQLACNCVTEFSVNFRPGKPCVKRDKIDTLSLEGHVHS